MNVRNLVTDSVTLLQVIYQENKQMQGNTAQLSENWKTRATLGCF